MRAVVRVAAVLLGLAAGLLVGEAILRLSSAGSRYDFRDALARAERSTPPPPSPGCTGGRGAELGELVRPSASHDLVYELKPGVDTCFYGARTTINADGQRAPVVYARAKPEGVHRILFLGDSLTFGQGVEHEQSFIALLQRELAVGSGRRVEIINAGVPGYNTAQEAAQLRQWGMSYRPDCVMVLFVGNDLAMPHLLLTELPQPELAGSRLLGRIRDLLRPPVPDPDRPWFFPTEELQSDENAYLARVPRELRHMVGSQGYRRALRSIKETAGTTPVVSFADYAPVSHLLDEREVIRFQRSLGLVHPDFRFPVSRRYWQSPTDAHLNPDGNRELTRRLLAALRQTGVCLPGTTR